MGKFDALEEEDLKITESPKWKSTDNSKIWYPLLFVDINAGSG